MGCKRGRGCTYAGWFRKRPLHYLSPNWEPRKRLPKRKEGLEVSKDIAEPNEIPDYLDPRLVAQKSPSEIPNAFVPPPKGLLLTYGHENGHKDSILFDQGSKSSYISSAF